MILDRRSKSIGGLRTEVFEDDEERIAYTNVERRLSITLIEVAIDIRKVKMIMSGSVEAPAEILRIIVESYESVIIAARPL
jgi:hypothetical protein